MAAISTAAWADATGDSPAVIVMRAIERGDLEPTADVELVLFTAAGAVLHRLFVERAPADAQWIERLLALLLDGVGARRAVGRSRTRRTRSRPS